MLTVYVCRSMCYSLLIKSLNYTYYGKLPSRPEVVTGVA